MRVHSRQKANVVQIHAASVPTPMMMEVTGLLEPAARMPYARPPWSCGIEVKWLYTAG